MRTHARRIQQVARFMLTPFFQWWRRHRPHGFASRLFGESMTRFSVLTVGSVMAIAMLTLTGCGIFLFGKYEPPSLRADQLTRVRVQNDFGPTAHLLVAKRPGACESTNKRVGWQPNGMLSNRKAVQFDVRRGEPIRIDIYDQGDNGGAWWHCFVNNVYTFDRADVMLRFVRVPGGCKVEMTDALGAAITQKVDRYDQQACKRNPQPVSNRGD